MVWGLIPAIFKAKYNTNETLFTLMLNYVAMQVVTFCIVFWENPAGSNTVGIIGAAGQKGWFPPVLGSTYGLNVILVAVLTVGIYIYMKYSKHGYASSVVGESQNTARYAGINVKRVIIRTMMLSGAICGFAGCLIVSGASHTISTSTHRRTRIYRDHRCVDVEVQPVCDDPGVSISRVTRRVDPDRIPVRVKRKRVGYHHRYSAVFPDRL